MASMASEDPEVDNLGKNDQEPNDTLPVSELQNKQKQKKKKKKKRKRGQGKTKERKVLEVGELPTEKNLKKGKVRHLNVLQREKENSVPRKFREMMARMSPNSGNFTSGNDPSLSAQDKDVNTAHDPKQASNGRVATDGDVRSGSRSKEETGDGAIMSKSSQPQQEVKDPEKRDEGLKPGESAQEFSARLSAERRKIVKDFMRSSNHQRLKKRSFYEKRRVRAKKRKKRNSGDLDESDAEDMTQELDEAETHLSQMPSFWQEIVRNNGRPLSERKKRRLERNNMETDEVKFGVQVERPPDLRQVTPVRRSKHSPSH